MKQRIIKIITVVLIMTGLLMCLPFGAGAYTPQYDVVRVGLRFNGNWSEIESPIPSGNLENNVGSGYIFGYFNSSRKFVSVGAYTSNTQISILVDRNMYWAADSRNYVSGTAGSIKVGCFHLRSSKSYATYTEASKAAAAYSNSFVRYENGKYYICIGSYTSSSSASNALISGFSVDSGTEYTVTVVETTTGKILFEYDDGTKSSLAVLPANSSMLSTAKTAAGNGTYANSSYSLANGNKTWFKGNKYYGAFEYTRVAGAGELTIVNLVNIEDYVRGVIPYEMSPSWPIEALKAQACCARSYVVNRGNWHSLAQVDVCGTQCCQAYYGVGDANDVTDRAVNETKGVYVTYNGAICSTYYGSTDCGVTLNSEDVWVAKIPYCRSVVDPYEAAAFINDDMWDIWQETYSQSDMGYLFSANGYSCSDIVSLHVTKYTTTGNVAELTAVDRNGKKIVITDSKMNDILGVPSTYFTVNNEPIITSNGGAKDQIVYVNGSSATINLKNPSDYYAEGDTGSGKLSGDVYVVDTDGSVVKVAAGSTASQPDVITTGYSGNASSFTIRGASDYGHRIGMSQWGAYAMAKYYNKTYDEILKFYFTGVTVG